MCMVFFSINMTLKFIPQLWGKLIDYEVHRPQGSTGGLEYCCSISIHSERDVHRVVEKTIWRHMLLIHFPIINVT